MQQQISVITLGVVDLQRSRRFYADGFGWSSVFENEEISFYQMNGFVLGTWLTSNLADDMERTGLTRPGAFALAHNVSSRDEVQPLIDRLVRAGGTQLCRKRGLKAVSRRLGRPKNQFRLAGDAGCETGDLGLRVDIVGFAGLNEEWIEAARSPSVFDPANRQLRGPTAMLLIGMCMPSTEGPAPMRLTQTFERGISSRNVSWTTSDCIGQPPVSKTCQRGGANKQS